jgi:hypothetical protein
MAGSAQPVGNILAEAFNLARFSPSLPVTLFAVALEIRLVCPVREGDIILELQNFRIVGCLRN